MSYITYRDLLESLEDLTEDQLDMTVTVYDADLDEYFPVNNATISNDDDILGHNHLVLEFNDDEAY